MGWLVWMYDVQVSVTPLMGDQVVVPIWTGASVLPDAVPADSKSMAVNVVSRITGK